MINSIHLFVYSLELFFFDLTFRLNLLHDLVLYGCFQNGMDLKSNWSFPVRNSVFILYHEKGIISKPVSSYVMDCLLHELAIILDAICIITHVVSKSV